nr:3D domain-containing protein [uncultured Agathobaculum sp.]
MFFFTRKHASKLIAAVVAVSTLASVSAAALDQPVALLSSNLNASVGNVLTSDEINAAEQALAQSKDKAETAAKEQAAAQTAYKDLLTAPVSARTVAYSTSLLASSTIKSNATALGSYKLSFYCPCATCNGKTGSKTASGTTPTEGRTIAVDSSIIPLGSRVYIEGYGMFIAEDTGSAIKNNKIDVFVSSHNRAYELGIQTANVYLLG